MSGPEDASVIAGLKFHHIGYAVENMADYLETFLRPLFAPLSVTAPITDPIQKVSVCFVEMPGGVVIELVEPAADDSPIRDIIGSPRGGVYHLCYEVADLDAAILAFRRKRCLPLAKPAPAAAFQNRRIVFLLTPQRDLIELVEAP
jgi:methylmalonyl-CoA/ethylmalonyl-CoA epimerase